MLKIICPNCDKENIFQSSGNIPSECTFCFTSFPTTITISENVDNSRDVTGLAIIYQINQQCIEISTLHKTILGRDNFGSSLFSKILFNGNPIVSRKHFSIEFKEGNFYILDEGSLNGTFFGVNKINCRNSPQIIEDNSIFFVGEEPFLAKINYKDQAHIEFEEQVEENLIETKSIKQYRCTKCGKNFEEKSETCPSCERFNTLIPVYD